MTLTDAQLASVAKAAGFTGADLAIAVAVALAESRGNPDAVGPTLDYGLWQIHASAWPNLMTAAVMAAGTWKDPAVNAGFAYHIWKWGGWTPWSTYKSGSYQTYLSRAQSAFEGGLMSHIDSIYLASNQLNKTGVYPAGPQYEKDIWAPAAVHFADEMVKQGHTCKVIYKAPESIPDPDGTTDELLVMVKQGNAYLPTVDGYKLAVSGHSNTGSGINYMMAVVLDSRHDVFAKKVTHDAVVRCGMVERSPYHRSIYFTSILDHYGPGHVILFETGEHQTAKNAAWLGKYAPFCVRMEARACIVACGFLLKSDGAVPGTVVVPAGAVFDKYRPGVVAPPAPPQPAITLPTLQITAAMSAPGSTVPYMRDKVDSTLITYAPIHWLQRTLNAHTTPTLPHLDTDGVYGPATKANVKAFQAVHYWNGGRLVATGVTDKATWAKLRTV